MTTAKSKDHEADLKRAQRELELSKAELEAHRKNPDEDPVMILSKSREYVRFPKQKETFRINLDKALEQIAYALNGKDFPTYTPKAFISILNEIVELLLDQINLQSPTAGVTAKGILQYRKFLIEIGYFFEELLIEEGDRGF